MALPVIKVEHLSKKFTISHETQERYNSFRDVIVNRAKSIVTRPKTKAVIKEEFFALNDVSFDITPGDRIGIIGRNGAGKSTLLKILSRITEPSEGRISIRGRVASLLEVGTGFHPELTGRENIFLNGAILGMNRSEIKRKFDEIVSFAEIEKFLDTPVKRYSSGMYVRLAFAVAAHLEPEILIVDEVLAVGDAQFQKKCLGKMDEVSKTHGRTVLFVSHNMGVINQLCKKSILLKGGKLVAYGPSDEIINQYISSDQEKSNRYSPDNSISQRKANYFSFIRSSNIKGEETGDFSFTDKIVLDFEFVVNNDTSNLQIGIGLNDKYQNRISTVIRPISAFSRQGNRFTGKVTLPDSLIAPNNYSFVFALWTRAGEVFDQVESVCPIKVYDNGTSLALYEGGDNGSIIINPTWEDA